MRKFYLTLVAAALSVTAASASGFTPVKAVKAEEPVKQTSIALESPKAKMHTAEAKPMESPDGNWTKVSTGIWFEGPLAARYSDVNEGQWEIDVYRNDSNPGWYRIMPYNENSQLYQILGRIDETPLDINTTNPDHTYFESWNPYNLMQMRTACPEGGFSNTEYGNLKDGVITFPTGCVAYASGSSWYLLNADIKIILDASTYKDYTVNFEAPLCSAASDQYFSFTTGADVAKVKAVFLDGEYPMNANNANVVKSQGTDITSYAGKRVNAGLDGTNTIWSILYVALDANDNIQTSGVKYTFIVEDDNDNWTDMGEATYTEAIISELFTDVDPEDLTCMAQKHTTINNYFRLVNPYAKHSLVSATNAISHDTHNHYLYINATDPLHVYIEPSVLGFKVNDNFGESAAMTWGYLYTDDVTTGETEGVWGNYTDNTVTIPAGNARLLMSAYQGGKFLSLGATTDIVVKLPENNSAISGIATDDTDAPAEYFNLQGIKVNKPAPGEVYIIRQGSKVSKTFVR